MFFIKESIRSDIQSSEKKVLDRNRFQKYFILLNIKHIFEIQTKHLIYNIQQ